MSAHAVRSSMRKLDTCDFCGDTASGVYEVVPEDVPADTHRLVLCDGCRETLTAVVSPLLDALDGERAGHDGPTAATREDTPRERAVTDAEADEVAAETEERDAADARSATLSVETPGSTPDAGGAAESPPDDADVETDSETGSASTAARPEGYAKVVRLLRNRPAAMSRADLVELASGAYGLDDEQVHEAIDAAVENGHVVETAEGLQT